MDSKRFENYHLLCLLRPFKERKEKKKKERRENTSLYFYLTVKQESKWNPTILQPANKNGAISEKNVWYGMVFITYTLDAECLSISRYISHSEWTVGLWMIRPGLACVNLNIFCTAVSKRADRKRLRE